MDYTEITLEDRIAGITTRLRALEEQHYSDVLNRLANGANVTAKHEIDKRLDDVAAAIVALRRERETLTAKSGATDASD